MKKTSFRLIFAALATAAVLAACAKVDVVEQSATDPASPAAEGTRVITVSFGPKTRTTLDKNSLQPMFADGDSILLETVPDLNNPEATLDTQTVAVTIDPTTQKTTITTTLQGNLSAMYPARLARLLANGGYDIPIFEEQSGLFEDANVCRARINAGATTAEFENVYSLFIITPPDGTQKLTVRSLPAIGDDGQRTDEAAKISNFSLGLEYTVTVSTPILSMPDTTYYVALLSDAYIRNLSFEAEYYTEGTGAVKGIGKAGLEIVADIDTTDNNGQIKSGWAYTIDKNNWHEYVTIGNRKWATMNIGANYPQEAGEYFAWGGTTGYVRNQADDGWCHIKANGDSLGLNGGFCWANCPHTEGTFITGENMKVFTKYVPSNKSGEYGYEDYYDTKTVLDLEDDAANVNWGGAWRMPTSEEFDVLEDSDSIWVSSPAGRYFRQGSNEIFLPAAGRGEGNSLDSEDKRSYFSSSLSLIKQVACLNIDEQKAIGDTTSRCFGLLIRPIIDEPVTISGK